MRYRRAWMPGGTFFFTVNLANHESDLLVRKVGELRHAFRNVQSKHPFHINAIVILPDHLHAIFTLPDNDRNYSVRWALIKAAFSRALPKSEGISASRASKGERGIWQRRFWEHQIRNDDDMQRHVDYIHWNPVKHGYAERAVDWQHSSIHRYIRYGLLASDWGCESEFDSNPFGERQR
ncbi:MAG TPA: transposase [Gammaproteobacteria bacterium]